jgi:predicted lysophospholipase L1 biosynthesis ABC-type transport system permease subunit
VPGDGIVDAPDLRADAQVPITQASRMVMLTLLGTLLIAGCSVAVAAAGGLVERRRPFALLRLGGMPLRALRGVVLREAALPLLVLAAASAALGLGVSWMVVRILGDSSSPWTLPPPSQALILVLGLALALGVVASVLPVLGRVTATEATRFE